MNIERVEWWREMSKTFNDCIHGHIELSRDCVSIIDTREYQRLRNLHQLGMTYRVFPCCTHTRFEHSLGVAHLSNQVIEKLDKNQPEMMIDDLDKKLVTIAGLCHDLGHGPFSHCFERFTGRVDYEFVHENYSTKLLKLLVDNNHLDVFDDDFSRGTTQAINRIGDYINGWPSKEGGEKDGKMFLFDIVSNHKNELDVDKFDYLQRDSYYLGAHDTALNISRLYQTMRVIGNEDLCFQKKTMVNLYNVFECRAQMFKSMYKHRVTCALDEMLIDVFQLANQSLGLIERCDDIEKFVDLTDHVIQEIYTKTHTEQLVIDNMLFESRDLLDRINRRQLYTFIGEEIVFDELVYREFWKDWEGEDLVAKAVDCRTSKGCGELDHWTQIRVHKFSIDYGFTDEHPISRVKLYEKDEPDIARRFSDFANEQIYLENSSFRGKVIRVYCTSMDKSIINAYRIAFDKIVNGDEFQYK